MLKNRWTLAEDTNKTTKNRLFPIMGKRDACGFYQYKLYEKLVSLETLDLAPTFMEILNLWIWH